MLRPPPLPLSSFLLWKMRKNIWEKWLLSQFYRFLSFFSILSLFFSKLLTRRDQKTQFPERLHSLAEISTTSGRQFILDDGNS